MFATPSRNHGPSEAPLIAESQQAADKAAGGASRCPGRDCQHTHTHTHFAPHIPEYLRVDARGGINISLCEMLCFIPLSPSFGLARPGLVQGSAAGLREPLEPAPDPPQTNSDLILPPSKAAVDSTELHGNGASSLLITPNPPHPPTPSVATSERPEPRVGSRRGGREYLQRQWNRRERNVWVCVCIWGGRW